MKKTKSLLRIKEELIEEKGACAICYYDFKPVLQIHHIKPVSLGGGDHLDNLLLLCPNCHKFIHAIYSDYPGTLYGSDYFDKWLDVNVSPTKKQMYLNYAMEILRSRYPSWEI